MKDVFIHIMSIPLLLSIHTHHNKCFIGGGGGGGDVVVVIIYFVIIRL